VPATLAGQVSVQHEHASSVEHAVVGATVRKRDDSCRIWTPRIALERAARVK